MASSTLAVIVEIVCRNTWAPVTSARCACTFPVVRPFADSEMTDGGVERLIP